MINEYCKKQWEGNGCDVQCDACKVSGLEHRIKKMEAVIREMLADGVKTTMTDLYYLEKAGIL